ncbi:hypothetical protein BgiMline_008933 [Biomphalaria glabrata]
MIHIHTGGGFSSGLGRKYPNSLNHADWKAPLRCGFLFCTFSCVLFVIGVILTWLGVHDVFGETVPITGPILLFVGGLMLLLAARQFYLAHTRKKLSCKSPVIPFIKISAFSLKICSLQSFFTKPLSPLTNSFFNV